MDKGKNHVNIDNARSDDQATELERISKENFCPFCSDDYLEKEHGKPILKRGTHWLATENRWPYKGTRFHLLFIHRKHLVSINELGQDDWNELRTIINELVDEMKIPGATLLLRFGDNKYTGGTVTHLHAQLVSGDPDSGTPVVTRIG